MQRRLIFIAPNCNCKRDNQDSNNIDVSIQIFNIAQSFTEIRIERTNTKKKLLLKGNRDCLDEIKIPFR